MLLNLASSSQKWHLEITAALDIGTGHICIPRGNCWTSQYKNSWCSGVPQSQAVKPSSHHRHYGYVLWNSPVLVCGPSPSLGNPLPNSGLHCISLKPVQKSAQLWCWSENTNYLEEQGESWHASVTSVGLRSVCVPAPPWRLNPIYIFWKVSVFRKSCAERRINLVSMSGRTRSNRLKLQPGSFRLDIKINFLTARVVKHQKRWPREDVKYPLRGSEDRLDTCLTGVTILMLLWGRGSYLDFSPSTISYSTLEIL